MIALQLFVYKNPYLVLFSSLLQNIFNGFAFIANIMVSDVLDYQQWKTGKRLEGFWQNYSSVIATIAGIFTGMLLPLFLSFGGIGFGDDMSVVLKDETLRDNAYKFQTLLALIGGVVAMIPIFFYDLSESKHANYVRSLKLRAAADNFRDGLLSDDDVLNVADILEYANDSGDEFVKDEISKHDCLAEISAKAPETRQRVRLAEREEEIADFLRDIELEFKRVDSRCEKNKQKALKKGMEYNESADRAEVMNKTRYLKYFTQGELANYKTAEDVNNNSEHVFSAVTACREKVN